ncbi:MAG: glycosyl hydrolase family 79 C-terminal domain-containing protein [Acidobacteriaceae bacterium]
MDRRRFLRNTTATVGWLASNQAFAQLSTASPGTAVQVTVHPDRVLGSVPADFMGFGYEISTIAMPNILSASNQVYVQLIRTLSPQGVIRVGGNTADYASFSRTGTALSSPKSTVVTLNNLVELRSFLKATGWKLIWGLNLGKGTEQQAVEEAVSVTATIEDGLLAFEIGNEPDLFPNEGHRSRDYNFAQYLDEYRRYKKAIRAQLPMARFAGPDVADKTEWVSEFAEAEGQDLVLLTHHYYRAGQSPESSFDMLLNPDPKLAPMLQSMRAASLKSTVPHRICETNSFSGGGRPGVSGTFGAALWVLDYLWTLASANASGVNMETGVNQRGFISSYSPIGDDEHGTYTARPEYYGMLAFSQACDARRIQVLAQTHGINLTAYAAETNASSIMVTLINKDSSRPAEVDVQSSANFTKATAMRMNGPDLASTSGITLGEAAVGIDGHWKPIRRETLPIQNRTASVLLAPCSAALVELT